MNEELKVELGVNEWLKLIEEDKNLNGAYISICQYIYLTEKENQELNKQVDELKKQLDKAHDELYTLKNKYNIRLLNQISENIEPDCEDYYLAEIETKANKYDLIQTQQKEFISYLGNEKDRLVRECSQIYEDSLGKTRLVNEDIFNEVNDILQKYKSIIGVSDENKRN